MSHGGIKRHYFKILRRRADAARSQGRWAVAASGYRRWLEYRSDDGPIWVQLGHMLREAGDIVGADESYRRAAALMPDDADLMFFRGYLEWRCGNTEAAASLYRQSYARDGNTQAAKAIEDLEANMAAQSPEPELSWMIDRVEDASADIEVTIAESYDDPAEAQDRPDVTSPIETPRVVGIVDHIDHDIVHG